MKKDAFSNLLYKLSKQSGQEKLRISFQLSQFVRQLRKQGELYAKKKQGFKPRATA
ncbi:MAG: hypothetical protein HYV39_00835 [Candidatus Levybacteria bacterium]|nr:hypothetical protein [Candidatus Levybacteria bacterium]